MFGHVQLYVFPFEACACICRKSKASVREAVAAA